MVDRDQEPLYSPLQIAARSSTPMFVLRNNQVKHDLRLILTFFFFFQCLTEIKTAPISLATLLVPVPKFVFFFKRKKQLLHPSFNLKIVSQIPEEDKDPVYKYFESMMTCARVREFNAKPPQVPILPEIFNTPTTSTAKEKKPAEDKPKIYFRTLYNHAKEGR